MRLDFNVLWVDDQPERVESQIRRITAQMEEEGFQFNSYSCKSMGDVQKFIAQNVFTDEIDLILVEWDLGADVRGENAIAAIKETVPYKDVVFYSAQTPSSTLRELAFANHLEGVYCASREELVDEVLGVFESLVKKVLDLDHTRGIVMGATSDIDNMVNQCLLAVHAKLQGTDREAMIKEALEHIEQKVKEITEQVTKIKNAATIATLLEAHLIFTAYDRLRILSRILKGERFKAHAGARSVVTTYMTKVVPGRNDLGHLILVPEGKAQAVLNKQGKQISLAETRQLRRLILRLRQDFRALLNALQVPDGSASSGRASLTRK